MPTINELLGIAKAKQTNLLTREVFMVRVLFKEYKWNRMSYRNRLLLGTLFLKYIKTDDICVAPIEKTSSGQQRYKLI